jgi:hypothetical protein
MLIRQMRVNGLQVIVTEVRQSHADDPLFVG